MYQITVFLCRGYCSPEYLLGGKMSVNSDMYSLGVIIIELVTGYKDIPDNNNVRVFLSDGPFLEAG